MSREGPSIHASRSWRPLAAASAVLLLTALAYVRTFDVPWYFDDVPNIVENASVRDLRGAIRNAFDGRGLGVLTFAIDYRRAGYSLAAFHATNLLVHGLAAVAVLFLLRRLFRGRLDLALFGSLVFALHPLQTGAVTYVVQRFASLAALFCLLSTLLYLRARDALVLEDSSGRIRFLLPYLGAIASGAAACFVKQNAVVLPALIGLVEALRSAPGARLSRRKRALLVLPLAIVPLWLALPVARTLVSSPGTPVAAPVEADVVGEGVSSIANLATQGEVLWRYLRRLVLPYGQVFDYGLEVDRDPWRATSITAALGLMVLAAAALALRRRAPRVTLGFLWLLAALAIESSVLVLDPYFEHRLYLPMFGFAVIACEGLNRLAGSKPRRLAALALASVTVLMLLTVRRNEQWRDPVALWRADLEAGSRSYRSLLGYADALFRQGDADGADRVYRVFLERAERRCQRTPCSSRYRLNMGVAAERVGDVARATSLYRTVTLSSPSYSVAHYNLGVLQYRSGEKKEAVESFRRAAESAPGDPDPLYNWAVAALDLGDPAPARRIEPLLRPVSPRLADALLEELREFSAGRATRSGAEAEEVDASAGEL